MNGQHNTPICREEDEGDSCAGGGFAHRRTPPAWPQEPLNWYSIPDENPIRREVPLSARRVLGLRRVPWRALFTLACAIAAMVLSVLWEVSR